MSVLSDMMAQRATPAHLQTMGDVVTHRPRTGSNVSVVGVFDEQPVAPLKDDSHGREVVRTATLFTGLKDVADNDFTPDDQGAFTIGGVLWQVASVATANGGRLFKLTTTDRKTMRRLPGNS